MPSGGTFVAQVENGLNTAIAFARKRKQKPTNVMTSLAEHQTLTEGTGTAWRESITENLTASTYTETDTIDNPQQLSVSLLTGTPQLVATHVFLGRRVRARLDSKTFATFGTVSQDAMDLKANTDGHGLFASATTTLGGTGTTASHGHILAASSRIAANTTEPGGNTKAAVLHGYTVYDLQSEVLSGVGTYPVPAGMTEEVYRRGFKGSVGDVMVYQDDTIAINATPDSRGGIFSSGRGGAVLLIQGLSPWTETKDRPERGYGGMDVWLKSEYVWVERSAGNHLFGHLADATVPTG